MNCSKIIQYTSGKAITSSKITKSLIILKD